MCNKHDISIASLAPGLVVVLQFQPTCRLMSNVCPNFGLQVAPLKLQADVISITAE